MKFLNPLSMLIWLSSLLLGATLSAKKESLGSCVLPEGAATRQTAAKLYLTKAEALETERNGIDRDVSRAYAAVVDCDASLSAKPWVKMGLYALDSNFMSAATTFSETAIRLNPRSIDSRILQGLLWAQMEKYKDAFAQCQGLLDESKNLEVKNRNLALKCVVESGFELQMALPVREALHLMEKDYQESDPAPISLIYFDLGRAYELGVDKIRYGKGSDLDKALSYFQKSFEHSRRHLWASFHVSLLFREKKDYKEAMKWMEFFIADFPGMDVGYYNMACFHALLGEIEPAMESLKKAIDLGFRDRKHMESDDDLKNLRDQSNFKKLMADLPKFG